MIFSFLFSFLFLEAIFSLTTKQEHLKNVFKIIELDQDYFWDTKKNIHTTFYGSNVRTNIDGLRHEDNHYTTNKIRILNMGASPTFGWGVNDDETYSSLLQQELGSKYEVINAGVIGHSSFQAKKKIINLIKTTRPHIITFAYVINDVDRLRFAQNNYTEDSKTPSPTFLFSKMTNLVHQTNFFWQMNQLFSHLKNKSTSQESFIHLSSAPARVSQEDFIKNIDELIQMARSHHAQVIPLVYPVNIPITNPPFCKGPKTHQEIRICLAEICSKDAQAYNNQLKNWLVKFKMPHVDLRKALLEDKDGNFLTQKNDTIHPSVKGHRIIAQELAKIINAL